MQLAACSGGGSIGGGGDDSWLYPLTVPTDVAVSDVDGDGLSDVLTLELLSTSAVEDEGRIRLYLQTTPGAFAASETYPVGDYPWRFVVADIDGDGVPELVVTDPQAEDVWIVRQQSGNRGRFDPPALLAAGIHAYDVAVADLNGDGHVDIALPDSGDATARIVILYRDASRPGVFLPAVDLPMPGATAHLAAGDLNRDGRQDLAASFQTAGGGATAPTIALGYRPQRPDGGLGPVTVLASQTGLNVARMIIADYDGDGGQDLIAYATPFSSRYRATLTVLRQSAVPGVFLAAAETALGDTRGLDDAAFADLNRDARPDAAVAGSFPVGAPSTVDARVNLFMQAGGGLFAPAAVHEMPVAVSRIGAGDLNGDGAVDLVAFAGEGGCQVLLQSPTRPGTFSLPRPLR